MFLLFEERLVVDLVVVATVIMLLLSFWKFSCFAQVGRCS